MRPEPVRNGDSAPLRIRCVGIDTYRENVAYLHRRCPLYLTEGFQALAKIEVHANGSSIVATLNIVDDPAIVAETELGLS
jgi:thymidine phosphorylase